MMATIGYCFLFLISLSLLSSLSLIIVVNATNKDTFITYPEDFGAIGDGKANDWIPLQNAFDSCIGKSSCRVILKKHYLSGPLFINASNMTLDIRGILAMLSKYGGYPTPENSNRDDYPPFISNGNGTSSTTNTVTDTNKCQVVNGFEVCLTNFRLTGNGIIKATDPELWWPCKYTDCFRPHMIELSYIYGVKVDNILLFEPANHALRTNRCVNVRIDHLRIEAPHNSPNTDGVNFYGGWDQSLTNSWISNGDDCVSVVPAGEDLSICITHPENVLCRGGHVYTRNVTCIGGHGISIGGMRHGTVTNVTFTNMTATWGNEDNSQDEFAVGGLRVKAYPNSTGSVSNIHYQDIILDRVFLPIQLWVNYCPPPCKSKPGTFVKFSNISFTNISGTGRQSSTIAHLNCVKESTCDNITLNNVQLDSSSNPGHGKVVCVYSKVNFMNNSLPDVCSPEPENDNNNKGISSSFGVDSTIKSRNTIFPKWKVKEM